MENEGDLIKNDTSEPYDIKPSDLDEPLSPMEIVQRHVEKKEVDNNETVKPTLGVQNHEIYRKMHLQDLKALVVSKGLTLDASKMKKNELLKLFEV